MTLQMTLQTLQMTLQGGAREPERPPPQVAALYLILLNNDLSNYQ